MNPNENDYALVTCLKLQHKRQHYVFKVRENIYLCNIPKISAYHPLLFDSVWNSIDDKLTACVFNTNQTNTILINGCSNASKQIFNTQLLSFILSKFHSRDRETAQQIASIPTIVDAVSCVQSSIYHYDPQCNLWLKIAYRRNHNNQNVIVGSHMDLIGINSNIFEDVSSLQHIPIISMLKAYFIKTPSMYLSSLPFNHKAITTLPTKDGFKQFVEFQKALTLLNFTEERQQDIFDLFIGLAHLCMIEYYHDTPGKVQFHVYAASSLLGINADSLRNVIFSARTGDAKRVFTDKVNGIIRHLYLSTIKSIVEHINAMTAPSVDVHSDPSVQVLCMFYIRGTEYDKVNRNDNNIDLLCTSYTQEILNNHLINRYVNRVNNQLYKEGIVLNHNIHKSCHVVSNVPSLIGASSHSICTVLDIVSNNMHRDTDHTINHKRITSDFIWLLNDRLKSKLRVNKERESFIVHHSLGDVEYNASEFSQRNRYYVDGDIIELLSNSSNLLVRTINSYNHKLMECKTNSLMNDYIAQSTDIMERITTTNDDMFMIYCLEPNTAMNASLDRLNEIQFDYKHVWNQLLCYPALFHIYYLSLHSYPYALSVSFVYYKFKSLFENSDYFNYLVDNPTLMSAALLSTFHFLQPNDYKLGTTNILFNSVDKLVAVKQIKIREISSQMRQKLEDWQQHHKLIAAKGILKVSKILCAMMDDMREASKIQNIIRKMVLWSKFHHKCISLKQRVRLWSSVQLRNHWHQMNKEERKSRIKTNANETAQMLNSKWRDMSNNIDSLYAEASKILSHRTRTFSMLDRHHPYLHLNKLELFGDAVVALSSPITIQKRNDQTWVDYVKAQNINPKHYLYKQFPRFTMINDKETVVVSPIDQHLQLQRKKNRVKPKSPPEFMKTLNSTMKHMVSEHKENGKTMAEITRDQSMQKMRQRKSKMRTTKSKKRMTAHILNKIKLENQRVSTMINSTKRFKKGLKQSGIRPSMLLQNITNEEAQMEESFGSMTARLSVINKAQASLSVDTAQLNKGEMILHCEDGVTKQIVMLFVDESGLNIVIEDDVYSLLRVLSVSLESGDKFTIHIQDEDRNQTKRILLEAANAKERDLWVHHIILMAKKSRGLKNSEVKEK
eukprot:327127_1